MPRTPDVRLPQRFEAAGEDGARVPLERWWIIYDDAQLTMLVDRALARGFDARLALARLAEARALRASTLARLGPQGNVEASAEARQTQELGAGNDFEIPGVPSDFSLTPNGRSATANLGFNVSWELDLFGRRAATRRAADADYAAAGFDAAATRTAVSAEIADTLFQARGVAVQVEDAEATLRIRREQLELAQRGAERGLVPGADADRIAADVAQAEAQLRELGAQLRTLRRSLLLLVGDAGADLDSLVVAPDLTSVPEPPALIPGALLARRPDVREARARIAAAAANLRLAELELFPRLSLRPGLGLQLQRGTPFESTTAFWAFGVGFTLPVLDRARLLAEIRASGARAEQAVLGYERAVQTAYAEADQALTLLEADRARLAVLRAGAERASTAYRAARIRYERGLDNLTSLLDAERAWRASRSAAAAAHAQALRRSVQTFRAFGGGWLPDAPIGENG